MTDVEISIIVPCYNEERHIAHLLDAIRLQTVSINRLEVIIADGISTDKTRSILQNYRDTHPDLTILVIDNPKRNIPSALNLAIEASSGEYIIRLDAHSIPQPDYVELCVQHLDENIAQNVGGVWIIQPGEDTRIARAVAIAAAHPLGVGGAQYRNANTQAGFVDTVPFGAYRRDFLNQIGNYDESLLSNEDYELNTRIRANGGKIYLDPKIRVTYFARRNLRTLSKQYFRYGFWKFKMLEKYPKSIRPRQLLPPIFVIGTIALAITAAFLPISFFVLTAILLIYGLGLFFGTFLAVKKSPYSLSVHVMVVAAIITMHLSWGFGFLYSFISGLLKG